MTASLARRCALSVVITSVILVSTLIRADEPLRSLVPQAVSAADVSEDGRVITVGTIAFAGDLGFENQDIDTQAEFAQREDTL